MSRYVFIPAVASGGGSLGEPWVSDQEDFLGGLISQLDTFERIKVGQSAMGFSNSGTSDGATEGGSRTVPNTTTNFFGASIFQTMNTGYWGISFLAKCATPVAGRVSAVGLCNAAGTHDALFGTSNTVSATNYSLLLDGTTSTTDDSGVVAAATYKTFSLTGNTVSVKAYIDGVLCVTRAIGTNVVDEPMYPCAFNTAASDVVVADIVFGYVSTT